MNLISSTRAFDGTLFKYAHQSVACNCEMKFNIFIPASVLPGSHAPMLYFLSGLTCNEDNFMQKSGALKLAALNGIVLVTPDTSPRGCNIDGEGENWDLGLGASYYVDATEEKWKRNYQMFSYVSSELPNLIFENFPVDKKRISIFGHSVGGHGALTVFLKNPGMFCSVSAFAPVSNPINCQWGIKAFTALLGSSDKSKWSAYDATELAKVYGGPKCHILIDQGSNDQFLIDGQLLVQDFVAETKKNSLFNVEYRLQKEYDHGYYFVSTFIQDHFEFHLKHLQK